MLVNFFNIRGFASTETNIYHHHHHHHRHCHHNHHHHRHHHHHPGLQCSWKYCNSKKSFTSSRKGGNLRHCNVKHKPVERNRIQEIQIFDKYLIFCVFVPFHIQNSLYKVPKWVGLKILLPKHPRKSKIGAQQLVLATKLYVFSQRKIPKNPGI